MTVVMSAIIAVQSRCLIRGTACSYHEGIFMKWELVGRLGFPTGCLPHWLAALIALQFLGSLTASLLRATFYGARR